MLLLAERLETRTGALTLTPRERRGLRARLVTITTTVGLIGSVVLAAGFVAATAGALTTHQSEDGELRFGVGGGTDNFCPPSALWSSAGLQVSAGIYDTLTVPNEQGRFVPYLALSVTPNPDFTRWTIMLRDGVTFHDGEALDARAVKLNLDAFTGRVPTNPPAVFIPSMLRFIAGVDVVDRLRVDVQLSEPVPRFPAYLYLEGRMAIAAPAQLESPDCATSMIGTGPFALVSFRPNEVTGSKNLSYWQRGYPKAERIVFTTLLDAGQRTSRLRSGGADVVAQSDGSEIARIKGFKGRFSVLEELPGFRETRYYLFNVSRAPFNDREARLAVAYALDRDTLDETIGDGRLEAANGLMDLGAPGYAKDAGYPVPDPDRARELVSRIEVATGRELTVSILTDSDGDNLAEAREIQAEMTDAGMTATITQASPQRMLGEVTSGRFDLLLWRNVHGGNATGCDADTAPWWSSGSPLNFGGFKNDRIQALLHQARAATTPEASHAACSLLNRAMAEEVYLLPVVYSQWAVAGRDGVDLTLPRLPDGSKPLFVDGRLPVLGLGFVKR